MTPATRMTCGKIPLPTVETCRHRSNAHVDVGEETAVCEILASIWRSFGRDRCRVGRAVCEACCRSFPPTADRWNPVVASWVQELADQVLADGNSLSDERATADRLRAIADAALEVVLPTRLQVVPARAHLNCIHWGDPSPSGTDRSPGAPRQGQVEHVCSHPSHRTTNIEQCRTCPDWTTSSPYSRWLTLEELVPPVRTRSGPRVQNWSVGVLTAPRRESTVECCLDSLRRAGWNAPHLFLDGLLEISARFARCNLTWRETPLGAWSHYLLSLQEMVHGNPNADAFLLVQDDAVFYDRANLREYLEQNLWPGDRPGIVSLYSSRAYTELTPAWRTLEQPWVWGALAFVFPRQTARDFVTDPLVLNHRWSGQSMDCAEIDVLIGRWAATRGIPIWFPNPSLVQHVGNTSTLWPHASNTGLRRANWFAGDLESAFSQGTSLADFPEEQFPALREFAPDYHAAMKRGRSRMQNLSVVICGLCRDVRHFLPRLAARIERLGAGFRDYRVVLFENDSHDATLEYLTDWRRRNERVHILSEVLGFERFPQIRSGERSVRMATYRNRYRDYAIDRFGDFDVVIVVDTDLGGGWSFDGVDHTFGQDDWDFVGSNGLLRTNADDVERYLHFDAWAFRMPGHPEPHENFEINRLVFERGQPLLPVLSCFGGLGVYRMEAFQSARYGSPDIEHAVLHFQMRDRGFGRQYLNPSQIVLYSPE